MSNLNPQQFSDYTFEHTHSRLGFHILRADHPDVPKHTASAGFLKWGDEGEIHNISVIPQHRRKGLATEMLRRAQDITPDVHHSDTLSDDAHAWINGMKKN